MDLFFPKKIVCLTEEVVEILYALGEQSRIIATSSYVKRPKEATSHHKVCTFMQANIKKILSLSPDLVIGFSDIQKDIARDLIAEGVNVFIANHRRLEEVMGYVRLIGNMIGQVEKTKTYIEQLRQKISTTEESVNLFKNRPKVYIEEWDEPRISSIAYFSDLVQLCGGIDINREKSVLGIKAKDRIIDDKHVIDANPDIIFACWCGKKVDILSIKSRDGWSDINAIKNDMIYELPPEIFLQPGPALIVDGIDMLIKYFKKYLNK